MQGKERGGRAARKKKPARWERVNPYQEETWRRQGSIYTRSWCDAIYFL